MPESGSPNAEKPDLKIGSYRLLEPLGSGGMSSVYRAVHVETGHEVAVKILPRSLAKNPTMLQRFLREAQSAEALEHPNIVSIYDRGVDQGRHYLVLEFVKGGDLHDRVRNDGPLEVGEAITVIRNVAAGLKYASERGLIHRDIKPANLLMSPTGEVKIIDLGLALNAANEDEDERVTRDGTTVGTVDYMAPEQARDSRATSERSDMYSLGCTFFYLLTGGPPFPGGDISDKLSRHCSKPPPDPCEVRSTIPRALGVLIRKMMAKKPENRFQNYDELLVALRGGALAEAVAHADSVDAQLADEDDGEIALAPVESGITGAVVAGKARGGEPRSPQGSSIDLADLAEEDSPPRRPRTSATPHSARGSAPEVDPEALLDEAEDDSLDEGDEDEMVEGLVAGRMVPTADPAAKTPMLKWIYAGVGGSVGLIVLVIIINLMIRPAQPKVDTAAVEAPLEAPIQPEPEPILAPAATPEPERAVPATPPPPPIVVAKVEPTAPQIVKSAVPAPTPTPRSSTAPTWVEPKDPVVERVADVMIAPDVEARFGLPDWAKAPIPPRVAGNFLKVRRITDTSNPQERASLSAAFEQIGSGTTELIDDGPFIESDLRLRGDARLLRAGEGRRPIIRLDRPKLEYLKDQPALFFIDGKQLILDGVDLIMDLQDLPREHSTLFHCKGGSLTLNNCTVTIVNPQNHPFSLIRAIGGDRPAQVRIERTYIRGSSMSVIEVAGGGVEVAIVRSVLAGGQGPMILSTGHAPAGERKIHLARSVLANRGPLLELTSPVGAKPAPVTIRALGSTFAHFQSDQPVSLISVHEDVAGEAKDFVNWQGEQNAIIGWNDWVSMGNGHSVKVASIAAARTTWAGTDALSQESPGAWPVPPDVNRIIPDQMRTLAPHGVSILTAVAAPSPFIFEKTIDEFKRPELPTFVSPIPNVVAADGVAGFIPGLNPPPFNPNPFGAPGAPADPNAPPVIPLKELVFDMTAKPLAGNIGKFLSEQVKPGDVRVKVRVTGAGRAYSTPVALPEGISLEIIVETTRAQGGQPPEWFAPKGLAGEALFAVKGGDLVLTGVELQRDATARLKALLQVEDGHLIVNHCRLKATAAPAEPGGCTLIVFRAPTTRPLPSRTGPFETPVDKPICRIIDSSLITSGDVLTATFGRGIVALTECAVAAGGAAFSLMPAAVARNRFEADLWLEHCTIAAEKTFVLLGPWPGSNPGPDRPWLVSSRDSAYMSSYTPVSVQSALLRVEPNSLAQGTLFWQGNNDAYELSNFTARSDKTLTMNTRPDVHRHWTSMWGTNHFRNATGPRTGTGSSVRLYGRLHAGDVTPGELALDPDVHPGRAEIDLGVDVRRLQVKPGVKPGAAPKRK